MNILKLGHVVLKVRNRERSEAFYHGVLGLPIQARYEPMPATFFSLGTDHHLLAVIAMGEDAPIPPANATGLRHIAFKIGDSTEDLRAARKEIDAAGCKITAMLDHCVTHSLYVEDPDGNVVELYVDTSDAWKDDPNLVVATPKPLAL
jgi:catechol 2,3-dioxygenase